MQVQLVVPMGYFYLEHKFITYLPQDKMATIS